MINTLLVVFFPAAGWKRIVEARHGVFYVLCTCVLPLLMLTSAAEGYGLARFGRWRSAVSHVKRFSPGEAAVIELFMFLLYLTVVFVGAKLVKSLGETFHGRHTYGQTFTVVAYGLGPFFLFRLLDIYPGISPWVSWSIGIFLTLAVLYHGLPLVMEPDPPHAYGLWLMSGLLLVLITGVARFFTAWYFAGRFTRLEPLISSLGAKLPF